LLVEIRILLRSVTNSGIDNFFLLDSPAGEEDVGPRWFRGAGRARRNIIH
jgi:hypothetical protein